jgi:hypothetical protein
MRNGRSYPPLTRGLRIAGRGSSSSPGLLKTPTAQLAVNGGSQHPDKRKAGGHGPTLADQVEHELLPTPTANISGRTGEQHMAMRRAMGRNTPSQLEAAAQLLPTPVAGDGDRASLTYERGNPTLLGALLPTPNATDGQGGTRTVPEKRTSRGKDHGPRLRDVAPVLLPTPSVADATGGHVTRGGARSGEPLLGGIAMLLPTPTAMDSHGARNATAKRSADKIGVNSDGWTLGDVFWTGDLTDPPSPGGKPS